MWLGYLPKNGSENWVDKIHTFLQESVPNTDKVIQRLKDINDMTSSCVQSQIQKYTDIDIDKDEYKDPKYGVNIFNVDDVEVGARVNHLCSCKLAASGGTRIHKHTQIHKNMQNILKDSNRHYSSYFVVPRGRLWSRI